MKPRPTSDITADIQSLQREGLARLFGRFLSTRVSALPLLFAAIALLLWVDPSPWRQVVVVLIGLIASTTFVVEWRRTLAGHRRVYSERRLVANVVGVALLQGVMFFATGGIESPVLPGMALVAVLSSLFLGRRPAVLVVPALYLLILAVLAATTLRPLLPDQNLLVFGGGTRAGHTDVHVIASAFAMGFLVVSSTVLGVALRGAFDEMLRQAFEARDLALQSHDERNLEMVTLTGEIAHELKNPLASIKGLAALLSKEPFFREGGPREGDGRAGERLAVLRGEVDRMQGIVEGFLNFSRPLSPLLLEEVALGKVLSEVALLHEGLARPRALRLEVTVEGDPVARCDRRKVKQILLNLLQNALDAAPPGSVVSLQAGAPEVASLLPVGLHSVPPRPVSPGPASPRAAPTQGATVVLRVADQGSGPDVSLPLFAPGITTKMQGSGLGLTIARALAAQHGGVLDLQPRPGGGAVATLTLLRDGPPTPLPAPAPLPPPPPFGPSLENPR